MRFTFDRFELDCERRQLLDGDGAIHISPKAFQLLHLLASAAPRAISKQELSDAIWPDTFVEECNLPGLIAELRSALGDDAHEPRFIRTLHGFGYSFCGSIERAGNRKQVAFLLCRGQQLPVYEGDNVIGRDLTADVSIDDAAVSRRHASLNVGADSAIISDLGSKNGTFVGDAKISAATPVDDGQSISVGSVRLTFTRSRENAATVTLRKV